MSIAPAIAAGESMVRTALWNDGRCTWIGHGFHVNGDDTPAYGTLGGDIYSGTAGVAWFLAHLYSVTGHEDVRRTAAGAMRHSLFAAGRQKREQRCSFYVGSIGIALVALELAKLLDVPEFARSARVLLHDVVRRGRNGASVDLVTGTGGAIAPLLALAARLPDDELFDFALRLGDQTIARAQRSDRGWSWLSGPEDPLPLTGFSHGAAGIGSALLELFEATAEARYRDAAIAAFEFERSWFDSRSENWPDFRGLSRVTRRTRPVPFGFYWCHGAPGIALSRIRAWEILGDELCRDESRAAIRTTRAAVVSSLESNRGSFSLCHGLAGNAEILYESRTAVEGYCPELVRRAVEQADARARLRRPDSPSLFLGSAGIGYLILRLHDGALPSLLVFRREQFV